MSASDLYRLIPSLNEVLLRPQIDALLERYPRELVLDSARSILQNVRQGIQAGKLDENLVVIHIERLDEDLRLEVERKLRYSLRPVINATGVILHTNLGRAPLSSRALSHLTQIAGTYSNLELDLDSGQRGRRDVHVESLLLRLLAMKAGRPEQEVSQTHRALLINNCAAATFLVLNSLAEGREVIVSRGELVEIGGGFRIPEILQKSGAVLREVGTTNRTNLSDYKSAISDRTGLILRVHQSNFRMEGFTKRVRLEELVELGRTAEIPVFEDHGAGLIASQEIVHGDRQASMVESFRSRVDLLAASGDKLFGGPQSGFVIGTADLVDRISSNPLLRAFRVCKLTYSAMEGTLVDYLSGDEQAIPILHMLTWSPGEIFERCKSLAACINSNVIRTDVVPTSAVIGGGTAPGQRVKSFAVVLRHRSMTPSAVASALRKLEPAVIGRIKKDRVLLDLRTVPPESDSLLKRILRFDADEDQPSAATA